MKKILEKLVLCGFILTGAMSMASCGGSAKEIAIVKLGAHTSLDEIEAAVEKELTSNLKGNYKIKKYDCSFDGDLITQTITGLPSDVACIIPIATPTAQVAANTFANSNTPIIFAAVSDPIAANLVTSLEKPTGNVTGTSDAIQVSSLIDKAIEIDTDIKTIGFIYNPNEDNSVSNKAKIEQYASSKNIEVISKTITSSAEMTEVANSIVNRVDAVLVTDDNTVASAMNTLGAITRAAKIPCYTGANSMVYDGGMLCVGIDYTDLGTRTGKMAIQAITGTPISNIPVQVCDDNLSIYLNETYVAQANITIPASILNSSQLIKYNEG